MTGPWEAWEEAGRNRDDEQTAAGLRDPATVPLPAVTGGGPAPGSASGTGRRDPVSPWSLALAVIVLLGIVVAATLILLQGRQ